MNILICFTGLTRTISKTFKNLKDTLCSSDNTTTIIFVTWEHENTDEFTICFPEAKIYRIPTISIEDDHFLEWKKNIQMHISWINTYGENHNALFQYYRQIFLWKETSIIADKYIGIDIYVRARTDVILSDTFAKEYYNKVNNKNIFFPKEPRHAFIEDKGCPDYIFIASKSTFLYALSIVDNIYYLYNKYGIPIQPETIMYFHLMDKNIDINYMNNTITIIRAQNFSKT